MRLPPLRPVLGRHGDRGQAPAHGPLQGSSYSDVTDHLVEKLALPTALGALTPTQYQAVVALAGSTERIPPSGPLRWE